MGVQLFQLFFPIISIISAIIFAALHFLTFHNFALAGAIHDRIAFIFKFRAFNELKMRRPYFWLGALSITWTEDIKVSLGKDNQMWNVPVRTTISIALLCMVIVLISGCTAIEVKNEQRSSNELTIKNFGKVRSIPIDIDEPISVHLANSQLHEFPEGKKHFRFVRIPPAEKRGYFVFRSYSNSEPRKLKVVIPKFMFLDEEGDHIQTITANTIIRDEEYWRGTSFYGRVSIPDNAKYAVIYAAEQADIPKIHITYRGRRWSVVPIEAGKFKLTLTVQPSVLLSDSKATGNSGKLQLFYLSEVDGKSVRNAINDSADASTKKGLRSRYVAVLTRRELPVKKMKVKLTGTHASAVPIKEIFRMIKGTFWSVTGEVEFEPVSGKNYIVKGELKEKGSAVWIEEEGTGRIVTEKVVEEI